MHLQMQFVKLSIDASTIHLIINTFKNAKRKVHRDNIFGSPDHEKFKRQNRDMDFQGKQEIFGTPEHVEIKKQMKEF